MNTLRNIFKNLLVSMILLTTVSMFAQPEKFNRANVLLREKNADLARPIIDSVVTHPETMNESASWTVRAYVYFYIYTRTDKYKLHSPLRDTIITSIKKSIALDKIKPDEDAAGNNKKLLVNLSAGYFNMAKALLQDSLNDEKSLYAYNKFKELYLLSDSTANFAVKDIEYFLAVGSTYSDIFIKDNKNVKAQNIAKVALLKVLEIQDDNPGANINLGLMYYNQAVNLTKDMAYDIDLNSIDAVQENIIKLARQSEQFVIKVYNKDNKNVKAIEALYYIYRMLLENAKSDEFKKIGETFGIKFNTDEKVADDAPGTDKPKEEIKEQPKDLPKEEKPKEEKKAEVAPPAKSKEEMAKEEKLNAEKAKEDKKAAEKKAKDDEKKAKEEEKAKKEADKKAQKEQEEKAKQAEKDAKEKAKADKEKAKETTNEVTPK